MIPGRAFKSLRQRFPTWEEVRDAPAPALEQAIAASTWPEQKAPRLKAILQAITLRNGHLHLDNLASLDVPQARAWLESLPGVGPKTSAAVLLFSALRRKAMPVDAHHYRVAARLGWLSPGEGEARAHAVLEALLPADFTAQQVYDHHEVMMFHGQKCCFYRNPDCPRCPLLSLCPTGQQNRASLPLAQAMEYA